MRREQREQCRRGVEGVAPTRRAALSTAPSSHFSTSPPTVCVVFSTACLPFGRSSKRAVIGHSVCLPTTLHPLHRRPVRFVHFVIGRRRCGSSSPHSLFVALSSLLVLLCICAFRDRLARRVTAPPPAGHGRLSASSLLVQDDWVGDFSMSPLFCFSLARSRVLRLADPIKLATMPSLSAVSPPPPSYVRVDLSLGR